MTEELQRCELLEHLLVLRHWLAAHQGYSGPCPKPPLPRQPSEVDQLRQRGNELAFMAGQVLRYGASPETREELRVRIERWNSIATAQRRPE